LDTLCWHENYRIEDIFAGKANLNVEPNMKSKGFANQKHSWVGFHFLSLTFRVNLKKCLWVDMSCAPGGCVLCTRWMCLVHRLKKKNKVVDHTFFNILVEIKLLLNLMSMVLAPMVIKCTCRMYVPTPISRVYLLNLLWTWWTQLNLWSYAKSAWFILLLLHRCRAGAALSRVGVKFRER